MIIFLIRIAIFLGSSAVGLWVTSLVVDGFDLSTSGFLAAVVVFTVAQAILSPFVAKMTLRYAGAFLGGVGLVSTYVALLVAETFTDGLVISGGVTTWIAAIVLVWLITALATLVLPIVFLRNRLNPDRAADVR